MIQRTVKETLNAKPTLEGAGVKLKRVFGYYHVPLFDPFLLLDHFGSQNPDDYLKGFPWHPHRGIETVTYMLTGQVEHGDSIGNKGVINSGDLQWMTAGNGIIHQEMPKKYHGFLQGFQLWVNLPAEKKMMEPRYRGITKEQIPTTKQKNTTIKIIAGEIDDTRGPVIDLIVDVDYFDITLKQGKEFTRYTRKDYKTFIYVIEGSGYLDEKHIDAQQCALFSEGDIVTIQANSTLRFLFISGQPIHEPVAWGGPIVMNTEAELEQAFRELDNGTFIKKSTPPAVAREFYTA